MKVINSVFKIDVCRTFQRSLISGVNVALLLSNKHGKVRMDDIKKIAFHNIIIQKSLLRGTLQVAKHLDICLVGRQHEASKIKHLNTINGYSEIEIKFILI